MKIRLTNPACATNGTKLLVKSVCETVFVFVFVFVNVTTGADPGFFLGGGALVSCSNSTPINHFFSRRIPVVLENRRSSQGGGGGMRPPCTLPLDPPLYYGPNETTTATATGTSKKQQNLMSETTTLHVYQAFLYISLPSLHNYDETWPNFTFT